MSSPPTPPSGPTSPSWQDREDQGAWTAQRPPFPGTEHLSPVEVFSGPGYQAPRSATDPVAVVALVLGVLSVVPGVGLLAAAAGGWALRRLRGRWASGLGMAWFAVVMGCATTVVWLWAWWLYDALRG
ncbi:MULTISPECIES: DUF4190 domain-containing protein [unclassified Actinomyces]|uniref:DUF4190 domain-containing protein n=1 Tax=unclassified Actinomyces TaxID=2609248 RepID=UPI002017351E|nr:MULTISPECIES: DUF4190 domain-containing protein [unclassified Actinomyces]MCL3778492.1 DUF4190 domain-containing protein [Actinomyces sp. AC-20-1]MCL3789684.1 DUF4190 domain-containing protein [Actinomyces sp. 187325]MCL3792826.1 DUF4190 domain-containing protein [Actinomyces sp. 186855]MCL3795392.1 DUF4190 domain-containing protein [Actinomyces sp. 217892]